MNTQIGALGYIDPLNKISSVADVTRQQQEQNSAEGFGSIFRGLLDDANVADIADQVSNVNVISGESSTLHEPTIAAEKAEITLRLTLSIRNKIVDAYTEIMRMQV